MLGRLLHRGIDLRCDEEWEGKVWSLLQPTRRRSGCQMKQVPDKPGEKGRT